MSERTENMFEALRKYYSSLGNNVSDTELISYSIETLFHDVSEKYNGQYRLLEETKLNEKQKVIFDLMCDNLDSIAQNAGNFLDDEIRYFIFYTQRFNFASRSIPHKDVSKMNVFQYDKVEALLLKQGYYEKDVFELAQALNLM